MRPSVFPSRVDSDPIGDWSTAMTTLSADEQRYLVDAFAFSPSEWFQPRQVSRDHFSDRAIDQLVESLARQGLMNGQPDCHARLTDLGRRTAEQAGILERRDWKQFYRRRRARIVVASVVVGLSVVLVILRTTGVL